VPMANTRLELDVQANKADECDLILHMLDGMRDLNFHHIVESRGCPEYTSKHPEEVATDYLTKVYRSLERKLFFDIFTHVDIVITVPVVRWKFFL
jgi:hypothetical protein